MSRFAMILAAATAGAGLAVGGGVLHAMTLPHTFTNGTVADAQSVNANFAALAGGIDSGGASVGDFKVSFLGFDQLKSAVGDPATFNPAVSKWAPADGRSVAGSAFAAYRATVPDLRGMFLRGLNQFDAAVGARADGYQDPDAAGRTGGNVAGSLQNDAFQTHVHYLESWYGQNGDGSANPRNSGYGNAGPYGNSIPTKAFDGASRVTSETRPKNVAVHYYVRIN